MTTAAMAEAEALRESGLGRNLKDIPLREEERKRDFLAVLTR